MKSSLAETFHDLSKDEASRDRIFPARKTSRKITDENDVALTPASVVVLRPYDEVFDSTQATSTLLVDNTLRAEYEALVKGIEQAKQAFLKQLKEVSGSRRLNEEEVSATFTDSESQFLPALAAVREEVLAQVEAAYASVKYDSIFNENVLGFLATKDFRTALEAYITKYDQLIAASQYFKKGIFNYYNAATVAKVLAANGFFQAKHSITLAGDVKRDIVTGEAFEALIQAEREAITDDQALREKFGAIEKQLEKNVALRDFHAYVLENQGLLPLLANVQLFKKELLKSYFKAKEAAYTDLVARYLATEARRAEIEAAAAVQRTQWERVIDIFNNRFFVPFTVIAHNKTDVMLKEGTPLTLGFSFRDGSDEAVVERADLLASLSTGEKKALYILNIIFDVEARIRSKQDTLFIVDDIADSFDYKNKYAIIEYLRDIAEVPHFTQLILTHNFDFFRTISSRFVGANNCFMAFRTEKGLVLDKAEGVTNIFVKDWKKEFFGDPRKKVASIPFIRNMIEYTRGAKDPEYQKLTALLHWKVPESSTITIGDLDKAFQSVFGGTGKSTDASKPVADLMVDAVADCLASSQGFNFENKIVLSIAIRLLAEQYMIKRINEPQFVKSIKANQTGRLFGRFKEKYGNEESVVRVLQKVILMTPESIHLNSFMYEPILDMSDEHLRRVYAELLAI